MPDCLKPHLPCALEKPKNQQVFYILITIALIFYFSCEKNNDCDNQLNFNGALINSYSCKYTKSAITETQDTLSCIIYLFNSDANKLTLKHINAGSNCYPDSLSVQSSLNSNTIAIEEFESSALCKCNCLYDLYFEITGIEAEKDHSI